MEGEEAEGLRGVEGVAGFTVELRGGEEEGGGKAAFGKRFADFGGTGAEEDEAVDAVADFGGEGEQWE